MTPEQWKALKAWIEAKIIDMASDHIEDRVRLNELEKDVIEAFGIGHAPK